MPRRQLRRIDFVQCGAVFAGLSISPKVSISAIVKHFGWLSAAISGSFEATANSAVSLRSVATV